MKEEKELELIEKNMKFDAEDNRWLAEYPWIKDPADLPDNRRVALSMLYSTERKLGKNPNMQLYTTTKFEIWSKEGSLVNSPKRNLSITKALSITFRTTRCSNQIPNLLPLESCLTVAQITWVTYLMSTGQRGQTCSTVGLEDVPYR